MTGREEEKKCLLEFCPTIHEFQLSQEAKARDERLDASLNGFFIYCFVSIDRGLDLV